MEVRWKGKERKGLEKVRVSVRVWVRGYNIPYISYTYYVVGVIKDE